MKYSLLVLAAHLTAANFARSQEEALSESIDSAASPPAPRILGPIPDGTPLPTEAPKPEYKAAPSDVLQSTTREQGGRSITIQRIKPIALPPPPLPVKASVEVSEEFSQRLTDYQEAHPRSGMMFIGATVYRSGDQPPRTLLRIWPEGNGNEAVELWSSADMALIAGGINSFQDSAGETHSLVISWSNLYVDRLSDLFASKGKEYTPPPMPVFTEGKATFQIIGKEPAAEHLIAIQSLHDLYNNQHAELLAAHQGREQARLQREAELKANPPQPKDITLRYWRTERPAAQGKGETRR